jgi:hypothetical protein
MPSFYSLRADDAQFSKVTDNGTVDKRGKYLVEHLPPPMAQLPLMGQGLPMIRASRSHSNTSHPIALLRTSDQSDTKTSS